MSVNYPRILPTGDRALTVEFGNEIDEHINARLMGLIRELSEERIKGIEEFVPSFRAVLIHYNPAILSYDRMTSILNAALAKPVSELSHHKRTVEVPVCYDIKYGPDIAFVAEHAGISIEEVIKIHTSTPYLVYMLGFQPGFPYLGGLDERIHTPRLETPRIKLEAGSVGIGGGQTGLYPMESPGGWRIIGVTPVRCYNPDKDKPIPYMAGDYIKFRAVSKEEFDELRERDIRGEFDFVVEE
ncbi:MAG: 5-oxoprolinase subunit PxpB [Lachnospiraceae bacterium]|nr:5-oxoprolinase subunit PxpB [Lachnospiraceae bacterium]